MKIHYVEHPKGDKEHTFWDGTASGVTVKVFVVVAKTHRAAVATLVSSRKI